MSPIDTHTMASAADEASPEGLILTPELDAHRLAYAEAAEALGSVPPPLSLKGVAKAGMAVLQGGAPSVFVDKLGERLAFERSGTRLYEALIIKYQAAQQATKEVLPPAAEALKALPGVDVLLEVLEEDPLETLTRIRNEELAHFQMLCDCMKRMCGYLAVRCRKIQGSLWPVSAGPKRASRGIRMDHAAKCDDMPHAMIQAG